MVKAGLDENIQERFEFSVFLQLRRKLRKGM